MKKRRRRKHPQITFFLIIILLTLTGFFVGNHFAKSTKQGIPPECLNIPPSFERTYCLKSFFEELTRKESAMIAVAKAKELRSQGIIHDCHLISHFIGNEVVRKHQYDIGKAFSECGWGCIQGCYHGVMEEFLNEKTTPQNLQEEIMHACDEVGVGHLKKRQCLHGIGHGLLFENNLPLAEGVRLCTQLNGSIRGETYKSICLGGLWMENMNAYLYLKEEELRQTIPSICETIFPLEDEKLTYGCIAGVGGGLMFYTDYNLEKGLEFCEHFPKVESQEICRKEARYEWEKRILQGKN